MNVIFMRHGEAVDNVQEILSNKETQCSILTEKGNQQVKKTASTIDFNIDKIYSSPLIRTLQTSRIISSDTIPIIIDDRIREIDWGEYSGKKNNKQLDDIRRRQTSGDFFVRFGQYGENKYDIELRLLEFLEEIYDTNFKNNTIMIVTHGTIISFMKRILNLKPSHAKKGSFEQFNNIDFSPLSIYRKKLKQARDNEVGKRIDLVNTLSSSVSLKTKSAYRKIAKDEFNNIELDFKTLNLLVQGLNDDLNKSFELSYVRANENPVLICLFKDFENFIDRWMAHYISAGAKNFVFINNGSTDNSLERIESHINKDISIDIWDVNIAYDCFRSCGWKQQLLEYYGTNRWYLVVDSDELFTIGKTFIIDEYINALESEQQTASKSLMLDVYSKKSLFSTGDEDFHLVDSYGYKKEFGKCYGYRVYGGPRQRLFGTRSSLQKISLFKYSGDEIMINDHFMYPWSVNKASMSSVLLHYKFISGDITKYNSFIKSGVHWNNSSEYKRYMDVYNNDENITFYNPQISINISDIKLSILFDN